MVKIAIFGEILVQSKDQHWTGLGLDWIRTITILFRFKVDSDFKSF